VFLALNWPEFLKTVTPSGPAESVQAPNCDCPPPLVTRVAWSVVFDLAGHGNTPPHALRPNAGLPTAQLDKRSPPTGPAFDAPEPKKRQTKTNDIPRSQLSTSLHARCQDGRPR